MLTTAEAADRLGIKPRSVVWAIKRGYIKAEKRGRDYWIEDSEIERYGQDRRARHRPKSYTVLGRDVSNEVSKTGGHEKGKPI